MHGGKAPGPEARVEEAAVARRHRPEGVAMVAAGQPNDAGFLRPAGQLPVLEGELERHLDGARPVVAEEDPVQAGRGQARELGGQLRPDRVREPEHRGMRDPVQLAPEGGIEVRIVVAMDIGPDRGIAIEVGPSLRIGEPPALALGDREGRQAGVFLHLRKRMPDMPQVRGMRACALGAQRRQIRFCHQGKALPPTRQDKPYVKGQPPLPLTRPIPYLRRHQWLLPGSPPGPPCRGPHPHRSSAA